MDSSKRNWEIDFLRGFAIILMVFFHTSFDLYYWGQSILGVQWDLKFIVKSYLPDLIGALFLLTVGISAQLKVRNHKGPYLSLFVGRGAKVLFCAGAITILSLIFSPNTVIYFGVLHCIGTSLFIIPFFLRYNYMNLFIGTFIVIAGHFIASVKVTYPWFMVFGFLPEDAVFGDYYPLFPWFGVILIGLFVGKVYLSSQGDFLPTFLRAREMSLSLWPMSELSRQ